MVRVIQRAFQDTTYSFVVPGSVTTRTNGTTNCFATTGYGTMNADCSNSSTTTGVVIPPQMRSFSTQGATLALQLPDGRIAVANCVSKYQPQGNFINRRSCRYPVSDTVEAEFKRDEVKMWWSVSLNGSVMQYETYRILGILGAQ